MLVRWLVLSFYVISSSAISNHTNNTPADSLDSTIQYHAFKTLVHPRDGIIYDVPLPTNLSCVNASAVMIGSSALWLQGFRIKSFQIPPRTISLPPVRRLIFIYQNLNNLSTSYYQVQNHNLIASVIGLLAYDCNGSRLDFEVRGDPIIISFPEVVDSPKARCVTFGSMGSQRLDNVIGMNECSSGNGGHFSIVVPKVGVLVPPPAREVAPKVEVSVSPPTMDVVEKRRWVAPTMGFGSGVVGLVILCLGGVVIAKVVKRKRLEKMGRKAEEGEVLDTAWVRGSKMPTASVSRTRPVLEKGSAL